MKQKILFLVNHDIVIYNFRKELVEKLLSSNFEIHIASPKGNKLSILSQMGCVIHELEINRHGKNPLEELKLIYSIKKIIKRLKPDLVLTYTIKPNIYGSLICKKLKIPCVANVTGIGTSLYENKITSKIILFFYKEALEKNYLSFFQNESNRDLFISSGLDIKKTSILPGSGVNLEDFIPLEYPKTKKINFLFLSRIMTDKGIGEYLEVAKRMKGKNLEVSFWVAGFIDGNYIEKINEAVEDNIIKYFGQVDEIKQLLLNTHCVVLPSYHEGMSNVLLESAASGRPIITTDVPGCREIVENNVTGFLIPPKNSFALEESILAFLQIERKKMIQMGVLGRKKVSKEFDRKIVVEKYYSTIKEILK